MRLARMHTGGKGIQAADTMRKSLFLKEIQRPISDWRLIAKALSGQPGQHIIGPKARCSSSKISSTRRRTGVSRSPFSATKASARASASVLQCAWSCAANAKSGTLQPGQASE